MADVHENKTNKEEVRLMTYEDEANYDDVTIEELSEFLEKEACAVENDGYKLLDALIN